MRPIRSSLLAFGALVIGLALAAVPAVSAQTFTHVYPVKFVCGFFNGAVLLSSPPAGGNAPLIYEDLKPGN